MDKLCQCDICGQSVCVDDFHILESAIGKSPWSICNDCYTKMSKPADHANTQVNIHKIIDDAMEKKDRTVSIFISGEHNSVSVNVYPIGHDEVYWILNKTGEGNIHFPICNNCGYVSPSRRPATYCGGCGELMHGCRLLEKEETS